ncbi:DUF6167 domain-containing protein [Nocardioides dubius]|uniref:Secreted protein n=1 Tax=Nocardioides dubius TaxID=317019 RepID=A0ABP4E5N2_9ACTN
MRRGFWFAAGAGAGIYAMNRARRLRESLTVEGLRDRAQALSLGARMFRDEVAQAQVDKEVELRERLGLAPPVRADRQLTAGSAPEPTPITSSRQRGTN